MLNSYLDSRPEVPDFEDLARAAVGGIEHDEFSVQLLRVDEGRWVLCLTSETRHHEVRPHRLDGRETTAEILERALAMIRVAYGDDAAYRFKFRGSAIFARGVA